MVLYSRSGEDIDRGLVGFWKLDDKRVSTSTAIDRANFNDGTITGAINTEGINGLNPDAMFFDGFDDFVDISGFSDLDLTGKEFSIACWFKPYSSHDGVIIDLNGFGTAANKGYQVKCTIADRIQFWAGNSFMTSSGSSELNEWNCLVVVFDGTNRVIYFDGDKDVLATTGRDANNNNNNIGQRVGNSFRFNGAIGLMRIYERALTDGEASKIARLRL